MNRNDRLPQLLQLLRHHDEPLSAWQLATALEVSVRSIYRDVELLRAQGARISGEAGVGYALEAGLLLPALLLSEDEVRALARGLSLAQGDPDRALARQASAVAQKLKAHLPSDLAALLRPKAPAAAKAQSAAPAPAAAKAKAKAKAPAPAPAAAKAQATAPAPAAAKAKAQTSLLPGGQAHKGANPQAFATAIRAHQKLQLLCGEPRRALTEVLAWPLALASFEGENHLVTWSESDQMIRSFPLTQVRQWEALPTRHQGDPKALLKAWGGQRQGWVLAKT